jgi:hypothetical protein
MTEPQDIIQFWAGNSIVQDALKKMYLLGLSKAEELVPEEQMTNKNCLLYEPDVCSLCEKRDEIKAFNTCRSTILEAIKVEKEKIK